jgi:signal transduction histidine kinase/ligand-binding sensor domain-containing protein/DNA-binding response OmpR family regulator
MIFRIVLLCFLFLPTSFLFSQEDNEERWRGKQVKYIGIEAGLSNNAVTSIYQDKRGFMWIGTYDGLNRYDGYNFYVFRNQPQDSSSLVSNRIVDIYEDHEGIWIGTKRGLSVYNYGTGSFERRLMEDFQSTLHVPVDFIINQITGRDGRLFLASAGKGMLVKDTGERNFVQVPFERNGELVYDYHAQGMDYDSKGNLIVFVQSNGIFRLTKSGTHLELISDVTNNANTLVVDIKDWIWIGMDGGLLGYDPVAKEERRFSRERTGHKVTAVMYERENEEVWAGTDGSGIMVVDTKSWSVSYLREGRYKGSITSNSVYSLHQDNKGDQWIGTLRGGINVMEDENRLFQTARNPEEKNGLAGNFVLSFCEKDEDEIWVGSDGGGLSLWDRTAGNFSTFLHSSDPSSLPNNFVTSILKSDRGVWVGTYGGGLSRYDETTGEFKRYPLFQHNYQEYQQNVWVLYRDSYQRIWAAVSDGEGLYRYDPAKDQFDFVDAKVYGILTMSEDLFGNLWVGNFDQLVKLDLDNFKNQVFDIGYPVRSIISASNDRMLVGTEGGGLLEIHPNSGVVQTFLEKDGLPNNSVLTILRGQDDEYWLSTYNGISRFSFPEKSFTNYYASDGLQSNQFNYNAGLKLASGELLFGGLNGVTIVNPTVARTTSSFPELLLTGIRINNENIEKYGQSPFSLAKLELPYGRSMLSFDFAALEYSLPDKISYAYYLEGWDREWNYVGKARVANYSKLTDGKYVLHVKSTNSDGIWNTETTSIPIVILPPWYRTPLAYLFYLLLGTAVLYGINRFQHRQARMRYEVLKSKEMAQKERELNEKKLNFFTNISHEFRSPLTMIINPLKDAVYGNRHTLEAGELEVVYRNSKRLLSLVDQLLLFRKAESDFGALRVARIDVVSVVREVFTCFVHHAESRGIRYGMETDLDVHWIYADRQKLEIAVFNLISNALKFTAEVDGQVNLAMSVDSEGEICIRVEDNGPGVSKQEAERVFELFYQSEHHSKSNRSGFGIGLYLVRQFVKMHSGQVAALPNYPSGTVFEIKLLPGKGHFQDVLIHEDLHEHSVFLEELLEVQPSDLVTDKNLKNIAPAGLWEQRKTLLVVDDNQEIREYLCSVFGDAYHMVKAVSAEEARDILKSQLPDLIISDVIMPEETGVDFCRFLKGDSRYRHIPIILLTGTKSEAVKLKGIEVGADDYITKPFDKDYLLARVKGIIRQQKVVQERLMEDVTQKRPDFKLSEEDKIFLERVEQIIEANLGEEDFTIKFLSEDIGMSHSLLYKKIKQLTGKSVNEMIRYVRLRKVAILLVTSEMQVNEAAYSAGFNDLKYFRKQFQQLYQMNPSDFQKKYKGTFQEKDYSLTRFDV